MPVRTKFTLLGIVLILTLVVAGQVWRPATRTRAAGSLSVGTIQPVSGTAHLNGIACPSSSTCYAVGSGSGANLGHGIVVPVNNGSSDGAQQVPDTDVLDSIDCPTSGACVAAGRNTPAPNGSGIAGGVVVPISNGSPGSRYQLGASCTYSGSSSSYSGSCDCPSGGTCAAALWGIACPASNNCVAVGQGFASDTSVAVPISYGSPVAVQETELAWTLDGIACPAGNTCYAVGQAASMSPAGTVVGITGILVGVNTAGSSVQLGGGVTSKGTWELHGIACPTSSLCYAVGQAGPLGPGVVVPITNGAPGVVQKVAVTRTLYGITCPTSDTCFAVGTDTAGSTGMVLAITNGGLGDVQSAPGSKTLRSIACPTSDTCYAVGEASSSGPGVVVPIDISAFTQLTLIPGAFPPAVLPQPTLVPIPGAFPPGALLPATVVPIPGAILPGALMPKCPLPSTVDVTSRSSGTPPAQWAQVNQDGFGYPPTSEGTHLLTFAGTLYAWNENGLFQIQDPVKRTWAKVTPPSQAGGTVRYLATDAALYAFDDDDLWFTPAAGMPQQNPAWQTITSQWPPAYWGPMNPSPPNYTPPSMPDTPAPMTVFNGQLYGVTYDSGGFTIWRSADIGQTTMNWQPVVPNAFGDPSNNQGVDFMAVFNKHVYAGTNTVKGVFGDTSQYGTGVEVWESASGDPGSWTQVNSDGFGTQITQPGASAPVRVNQYVWAWAVYQPPAASQAYLYVGTSSALGGEVWCYNGAGKGGWRNVTPPTGPDTATGAAGLGTTGPLRNQAMAVYNGTLYVAEGYPTGNLWAYDGQSWSRVVRGPNPFDPQNGGVRSLAVQDGKLYAGTLHAPYVSATKGDQVWGYPFASPSP